MLSGRLSYALPAWGLTLSAAGEGLLVHEAEGFREWGASGALRFDPGAPGRGLALRVGTLLGRGRKRRPAGWWALPDAASLAPAAAQPAPRRTPRRRAQLRPGRAPAEPAPSPPTPA